MNPYNNSPKNTTSIDDCPIIRAHWPDADFAEQAAAGAFGPNYVAPTDHDFTDRRPGEWQLLGDVATRVLHKTATRMALRSPRKDEAA